MMSDLMRDEFEAWVQKRAARSPAGFYPRLLKRHDLDPDSYAISWVDSAFQGWQASRECLVIKLPNFDDYPASMEKEMQESLKVAIHAAGVKTK